MLELKHLVADFSVRVHSSHVCKLWERPELTVLATESARLARQRAQQAGRGAIGGAGFDIVVLKVRSPLCAACRLASAAHALPCAPRGLSGLSGALPLALCCNGPPPLRARAPLRPTPRT